MSKDKEEITKHMKSVHDDKGGHNVKKKSKTHEHKERVDRGLNCSPCKATSKPNLEAERHEETVHQPESIGCDKC